ncbi:unnamed protein product [Chironomus riparius]|uniref:Uncharacterized protein n=1 Tax=Chironomus riparius TaxID=315576 RepID=A0A9N9WM41_9DIPT|nr:unnamed protein product [Chironomus riparius]
MEHFMIALALSLFIMPDNHINNNPRKPKVSLLSIIARWHAYTLRMVENTNINMAILTRKTIRSDHLDARLLNSLKMKKKLAAMNKILEKERKLYTNALSKI